MVVIITNGISELNKRMCNYRITVAHSADEISQLITSAEESKKSFINVINVTTKSYEYININNIISYHEKKN